MEKFCLDKNLSANFDCCWFFLKALVFGNCFHLVGSYNVVVKVHRLRAKCRMNAGSNSMVLETQKSQSESCVNGLLSRRPERRSRPRAALEWTVHVSRADGGHPATGKTTNVSSKGFYCVVQEPIEPGERVECTMIIPIPKSATPDDVLCLNCQARALRVEPAAGALGIAFQIEEYCVVHRSTTK